MSRRIIHDTDYMQFIMTPPLRNEVEYENYIPQVSAMKVLSSKNNEGLGQLPAVSSGSSENQSWVMPVVIIVISAMALMTLYSVLSKR